MQGRMGRDGFYASLPITGTFEHAINENAFEPLPHDWLIGLADVVASTAAVADGRYKAVNLAGAAAISALSNAFGTLEFPFVFTGDGMACAVPAEDADLLRRTLADTMGWIADSLGLALRGAIVPVAAIRAAGLDVKVARFAPSRHVTYAMFSGGGLAWADAALKAGRLPVLMPSDGRPDIKGLTCRFQPIPSRHGVIVSLVVAPVDRSDPAPFQSLLDDVTAMTAGLNPVPIGGPAWGWRSDGLEHEARLRRDRGTSLAASRLAVRVRTLLAALVVRLGLPVGGFEATRYRSQIAENADFRKFGDNLMMTLDCTPDLADRLEGRLAAAAAQGVADFGIHRQEAALMTCLVPAPAEAGHIHFIDGAGGGYTMAARALKQAAAGRLPAMQPEV